MRRLLTFLAAVVFVIAMSSEQAYSQHKLESWYFYFGLGFADPQYPGQLDNDIDAFADQPGVNRVRGGVDLPGFYWRRGDRTIIGGIINAFADRLEITDQDVKVQLTGFTIAFSAMHFLTHEVGRGLFVRGDVGPSRFELDVDGAGLFAGGRASSDWGFGALVGGGYALPISRGTRLLINANYAFRRVEGETFGAFAITVGGLF